MMNRNVQVVCRLLQFRAGRMGWLLLFLAMQFGFAVETRGDEPLLPIRCHVWGRFEVGAWSRTTVDVETYDAGVRLARTEREETRILSATSDDGYELVVESSDSVPGRNDRRVERSRVSRNFPWFVSRERLIGPEEGLGVEFELFGQKLHCRSFEYQLESEGRVTTYVDVIHVDRFPYILHRVGAATENRPDRAAEFLTKTSISHADVAIGLGDRIVSGVETRTLVERSGRTTEVIELLAAEVPGGLVSKRSTERNAEGELLRREVVELVDFATEGEPPAAVTTEADDEEESQPNRQGRLLRRWSRIQGNRLGGE